MEAIKICRGTVVIWAKKTHPNSTTMVMGLVHHPLDDQSAVIEIVEPGIKERKYLTVPLGELKKVSW